MATVLDVFDNFLGEEDCTAAARLDDDVWSRLVEELRRFYSSWEPVGEHTGLIPGAWRARHWLDATYRDTLTSDLLLFDTVFVHDPIEPFISQYVPKAYPGEPELSDDQIPLYLTHVPSQRSGQLPTIISAHYPPVAKAFLTVDEAVLARRHRTHPTVLAALKALEDWRSLVRTGAMQLLPAIELSHRLTPTIAKLGEAQIARTSRLLAIAAPETILASFNRRGGWPTPSWGPIGKAARDNARHSSWVYAREIAIARYLGSLYAASTDFDRDFLLGSDPAIPQANGNLTMLADIGIPGITGVSLTALSAIRSDSAAFAELRDLMRSLVLSPPFEGDFGDFPRLMDEHLNSQMARLRAEAQSIHRGLGAVVFSGLLRVAAPTAAAAALPLLQGDLRLAAGTAALTAAGVITGTQPRQPTPRKRALRWLQQSLDRDHAEPLV